MKSSLISQGSPKEADDYGNVGSDGEAPPIVCDVMVGISLSHKMAAPPRGPITRCPNIDLGLLHAENCEVMLAGHLSRKVYRALVTVSLNRSTAMKRLNMQ